MNQDDLTTAAVESQFHSIFEASSIGLAIVGMDGRVIHLNMAAAHLLNQRKDALIGFPFPHAFRPGKTISIGIPVEGGEERHVEVNTTEIAWNQTPAFLLSLHDLTTLEKIERLKAEITERKRLDKLKDDFISTVSHELRTPLSIVKGAVDNLRDGVVGPVEARQARVIDIAHSNINRLVKIINNLLDLSRLEAETAPLKLQDISLVDLVESILPGFILAAEKKGVAFTKDLDEGLPLVKADPDMIGQLITNFLDNALKFAKTVVRIRVQLQSGEGKRFVELTVEEDGRGIPEAEQAQLFNKFVQLNRPQGGAGYKGTGLGLAICKEIVHRHEGRIWVVNSHLGGAAFHASLPVG